MANVSDAPPPPGKLPTWDFYGQSPSAARICGMAQAILDGKAVDGPPAEVEAAKKLAAKYKR